MAELSSEELEKIVKEEDNSIKPMKEFESPEKLYQELIASVRKYHPSTDISLIEKAYNIAYEAHKGQVRKSGEPYIIHPLCVAIILAELELDKETIVAGLLHDVVEDTVMTDEEIRQELIRATRRKRWNEMLLFQQESELLLDATLDMDGEAVAERIEKIHEEYASTIQYNNENSLSSVLALAYLSAMQYYFKPVRELPTGRGFADFVFIPKPEYKSDYPALVVELKWNKSAVSVLQQIKDRKYPDSIQDYTGDILLVGINYSKKDKKHECVIKAYKKK